MNIEEVLSRLVMEIMVQKPCLSVPLITLKRVKDTEMNHPMAISDTSLYYNPFQLETLQEKSIKFILLHEAYHFFQKAPQRIKQYIEGNESLWKSEDAILYGIALDLACNYALITEGFTPPVESYSGACIPSIGTYKEFPVGKDAEYYFSLLKRKNEERKQEQQEQKQNGGENGDDQGSGNRSEKGDDKSDEDQEDAGEDEQGDEGYEGGDGNPVKSSKSHGAGKKRKGNRDDGGGRDDGDEEGEEREDGTGKLADGRSIGTLSLKELLDNLKDVPIDIIPGDKVSESEVDSQMASALALAQTMSAGVGGHVSDCFSQLIKKELEPPKVPWQRQLRFAMTKRETVRPSYLRPNRRRHSGDFIFPSRNNKTLGNVSLVMDTSGSMMCYLSMIAHECFNLVKQFPKSEFRIIIGDTCVRKELVFTTHAPRLNPSEWGIKGNGGTDMTPLFKRAMEKKSEILICATDMELPRFPPQPSIPVIWLVPIRYKKVWENRAPAYGRMIFVE